MADRLTADIPGPATVLALDGGNSKTDVVLLTGRGEVVARARCGPFQPHIVGAATAVASVGPAVRDVLRFTATGRADHLAAYLAGVDLPEETAAIRESLHAKGWADTAVVDNDTFALLRAGTDRDFGVAVVCGAGINCVGVAPDGTHLRFPALGRISGDWGGGQELAEEALWWAVRAEDGRGVATALASATATHFGLTDATAVAARFHLGTYPAGRMHELVTLLFSVATDGDHVAQSIVLRQAEEIVLLVSTTVRRLGMEATAVDVVLGGGVLAGRDRVLLDPLTVRLREAVPMARATILTTPPVVGACLLGLEQLWGRRPTPDPAGLEDALRRARAGIEAASILARTAPTGAS